MDLSKIKMVVTDMDGTLLNSNHQVSPLFFALFKKLREQNMLFVAASGRQYNSIVDKLDAIKEDLIVIAENGAYVREKDKELLTNPLPLDSVRELLGVLEMIPGVYPVLCGKTNAYTQGGSDDFIDKLKEYYSEFTILEDLKEFSGEILKIAVYHFESSEKFIYPRVQHLENRLQVKVSGKNWLDLSDINAHKGYALKQIQKQYGIGPKETMVFGDYNNDLEMLALSDYSFAMANAHPNVFKVAKYNTLSNDEFGVETVLERLLDGRME